MKKIILTVIMTATFSVAHSLSLGQADIRHLFKGADAVAYVYIEAGEMVQNNSMYCGAKYQGRVLQAFKNTNVGEVLDFGHYTGYGIGNT